jgi:CDP-diacylglycerol--serine O-phosphatidyltransferase
MKKHVPNLITSLNLLSGSLSAIFAFYDLHLAAWLVLLSLLFDFLDGLAARVLKAESPFGKQLDSLADVISFGLAPALMLFMIFLKSWNLPEIRLGYLYLLPCISLLIPLFSALRLARFNIERASNDNFFGLPAPANALLLVSIPLILHHEGESSYIGHFLLNSYTLSAFVLISCFLLVSRIKMLSLKFKNLKLKGNELRFILLLLALALVILFKFVAIPIIIILYILISILFIRK